MYFTIRTIYFLQAYIILVTTLHHISYYSISDEHSCTIVYYQHLLLMRGNIFLRRSIVPDPAAFGKPKILKKSAKIKLYTIAFVEVIE